MQEDDIALLEIEKTDKNHAVTIPAFLQVEPSTDNPHYNNAYIAGLSQ